MADDVKALAKQLQDKINEVVEGLLEFEDVDLDKLVTLDAGNGHTLSTTPRAAIRSYIEEYNAHKGQIAGNQYLTSVSRIAEQVQKEGGFTRPYDRSEIARLAGDLLVAAAQVSAQLVGYPSQLIDERPKENEWTIREILDHLIKMEEAFSILGLMKKASQGQA
jgi:hypothetical protein